MVHPVGSLDEGWTAADLRPGETDAVGRSTVVYLLLQGRPTGAFDPGLAPLHADRISLDRFCDILQVLVPQRPVVQIQLAFDLVVGLTRQTYLAHIRYALQAGDNIDTVTVNIV